MNCAPAFLISHMVLISKNIYNMLMQKLNRKLLINIIFNNSRGKQ